MPRRKDGSLALGIYLPQIRKHLTFSGEEFKKHVQQAGGEVNTTVTFLKNGSKSATPELEWDESELDLECIICPTASHIHTVICA